MKKRDIVARFKVLLLELPNLVKLVWRLIRDPRVSSMDKAILGGVVLYVLNPIDLIPDVIPVVGQIDDAYLLALALLRFMQRTDPEVLYQHWEGKTDILPLLDEIIDLATIYMPAGMRRVLMGKASRPSPGPPAGGPVDLE